MFTGNISFLCHLFLLDDWIPLPFQRYWHATLIRNSASTKSRLHSCIFQTLAGTNKVYMWMIKMPILRKTLFASLHLATSITQKARWLCSWTVTANVIQIQQLNISALILLGGERCAFACKQEEKNSLNINQVQSSDRKHSYKLNMKVECWCKGYLSFCTAK